MDIVCITGATSISGASPSPISVTVTHQGEVRQLAMDVAPHAAGGWQARHRGGAWGLRCHSVHTAVLLEAAEAFVDQPMALAAE